MSVVCTGRVVLLSFALAVVEVTNGSAWLLRCAQLGRLLRTGLRWSNALSTSVS